MSERSTSFDANSPGLSSGWMALTAITPPFSKVIEKIRPGGVLIIDNINRYLPSRSYSPESRSPAEGPKGAVWKDVADRMSGWRYIWTTSGIGDTALFFKPCMNL